MGIPLHVRRKLQDALGADAAGDLVAELEGMDTLRSEAVELRHEMRLGFAKIDGRFAAMDERFNTLEERFAGAIEKGLREQTRFFFVAWAVILAGIIGLYAR